DAKVKEIDFTININGSFTKLARFLADLSKLPRLIRVESDGLSKTEQGGLSMTVNAKAFFFQH
ncbi:type 4a pilus biogenesis protein PilO, partial [Candidatus Daviesbacteria bacterium]|nr:type 4a pilus biogenesis protein PilO [Candidatus Daviesbacteria bacterium]